MSIFTRRNALLGWLVFLVARRRLRRKAGALAGRRPERRGLLLGAGALTAAALGAAVRRRARHAQAEPA
jgi:hypothetical protein